MTIFKKLQKNLEKFNKKGARKLILLEIFEKNVRKI